MRRKTLLILVPLLILVSAVAFYSFAGHETPPDQPPLMVLNGQSLETIQALFNRSADRYRMILLLSPT